jgi:protein phosphatase
MANVRTEERVHAARSSISPYARDPIGLPWAAHSDSGPLHSCNEDRCGADARHGLFVLADGMGGSGAGELAADIAVTSTLESLRLARRTGAAIDDALCRAVQGAHTRIVAAARPGCLGMGTTLVVAVIDHDLLSIAHVGDSRAYLLREGTLTQVTTDHSVAQQMLDAGEISLAQARRIIARACLTRAVGLRGRPPQVQLSHVRWREGDRVLLCSDGLTDALDDDRLRDCLLRAVSGAAPAADAAARAVHDLVEAALRAGCQDNVTVLLAGGGPSLAEPV